MLLCDCVQEDDDDDDEDENGAGPREPEKAVMNVAERKNFCLMTIALIQGVDRSLAQTVDLIQQDFGFVTRASSTTDSRQQQSPASAGLWRAWAR